MDNRTLDQISLDNNPAEQETPISLDITNPVTPSPGVAEQRAFKIQQGLGSILNRPYEDLYNDLMAGREKAIRETASSALDYQNAKDRQIKITGLANSGLLTQASLKTLLDPTALANQQVDPETVIEKGYGHAVVGSLDQAATNMNSPVWKEANEVTPQTVQATKDAGSTLAAKRELAQTMYEDVQDEIKNQSTGSWLMNTAKSLVPGYTEYELRNVVPGGSFTEGLGLGENQYLQSRRLLALPMEQYKQGLQQVVTELRQHSPYLAAQFLQSVLGQSTTDVIKSNIGTALDIASVPGIGKAGKIALRAAGLIDTSRQAVKDVVEGAAVSQATKANMSAAAGDVKEGAVHQVTSDLVNLDNGTRTFQKDAVDSLTSNLNGMFDKIKNDPGRLTREQVTRIKDRWDSVVEDIRKGINSKLKVDRIPEMKIDENVIRAVQDDIRQDYRGMPNKLLDISQPEWHVDTNTWWFEHKLGTEAGELFNSPEAAAKDAELNGLILRTTSKDLDNINQRIAELQEQLREPPAMDADVHELNRYQKMENELNSLNQKKEDLKFTGGEGYSIEQQGLGWYLSKWAPMNEESPTMLNALSQLGKDRLFQAGVSRQNWTDYFMPAWAKTALGWIRTPEEVLSEAENDQRKIATHGPNILLSKFKEASSEIQSIPKRHWDRFNRTLEAARHLDDPQGLHGYFFETPGQLDNFYLSNFGELPTEAETEAYFAFTRNVELERSLRNIAVYRNKARLGAESHRVVLKGKNGEKVASNFFDGMSMREMPNGEHTMVIFGDEPGQESILQANSAINKRFQVIRDAVKQGQLKVIRLYDPETRPLQGFGSITDQRVRYVITKNLETKPLSYEQIGKRGGGHFEFDVDQYIKQAKVKPETLGSRIRHYYEGDTTVLAGSPINALNQQIVRHLNNVRELLRAGREQEAEAYNNANLHIPWNEHRGWYNPKRGPGGVEIPARLSLEEPFHVVNRNGSIMDMHSKELEGRYGAIDPITGKFHSTLIDGTKSGSDARQFQVQYTGERDVDNLMRLNDVGTRRNPLLQYEAAPMVDPIVTYNRATNRIVNSLYMDDMKLYSIHHWLEQAKDFLKADTNSLRTQPFFHFKKPDWKTGADVDPIRKLNLMTAHKMIDQFVGTPSAVDNYMHRATQMAVDAIYSRLGTKPASLLSNYMLHRTKDPLSFLRTVTFHAKLGLFNVPQLFTQAMTMTNIYGIAGHKAASTGFAAAWFHRLASLNADETILRAMDDRMSRFSYLIPGGYRWRPGEWMEARQLLQDSGFETIGGEHAFLDTPFYAKMVNNGGQKFLDWGESFFREGAKQTRLSAFYTAYREFRELHPTGIITRANAEDILSRAALLDHNMSRASNSALHTGILAPAGQFMAYSLRLAELMTGKRLTGAEKFRLFTISSLMYGLPLGGIGLYGFPIGDYIRQKAEDAGYVVGESAIASLIAEGMPAAITAYITGHGDMSKGTWYNFSKWGPEAYQVLENSMNSDSTLWKIFGGATFGVLSDSWNLSSGIRHWMTNVIRPDNQQFPITADDFIEPFKTISSANQWLRLRAALNTGNWLSRNGVPLDTVSPASAIFSTITGLQHTQVADITISSQAIKQRENMIKQGRSEFIKYVHRALVAADNKDLKQANVYMRQAKAVMEMYGIPYNRRSSMLAMALRGHETLIQRLDQDQFLHNLPPGEAEQRLNIYARKQRLQQERNQ